jgi:natural product biosynthesis luciferase-like monooxygenase protein
MNFGIMFFSSMNQNSNGNRYSLLKAAARFADQHEFCAIWTPERHFHEFGGLFPNPSVTSAALAMITDRLEIRAGSLISPLHDPVRIAEEWSVVDNLSHGRVGISFGSGWNVDDFIFFPDRYDVRHKLMYSQIDIVRRLWRGEGVSRENGFAKPIEVRISPEPIQPNLPIWITSSGNPDTFVRAGSIGANVLTHLLGQEISALASKIALYRESRAKQNFDPKAGIVTLMLHTFVGRSAEEVVAKAGTPFREYLRSAITLERKAALGGGVISGGHKLTTDEIAGGDIEELVDIACDRYFKTASLMGSFSDCSRFVWQLKEIGVDEIACLIDFGIDDESVLSSLQSLSELQAAFSSERTETAARKQLVEFMQSLED